LKVEKGAHERDDRTRRADSPTTEVDGAAATVSSRRAASRNLATRPTAIGAEGRRAAAARDIPIQTRADSEADDEGLLELVGSATVVQPASAMTTIESASTGKRSKPTRSSASPFARLHGPSLNCRQEEEPMEGKRSKRGRHLPGRVVFSPKKVPAKKLK